MIIYKVSLGYKHLNVEARQQRDYAYKPQLSGMYCGKCTGIDTIIDFYQMPAPYNIVTARIKACCSLFEQRIRLKIGKKQDELD